MTSLGTEQGYERVVLYHGGDMVFGEPQWEYVGEYDGSAVPPSMILPSPVVKVVFASDLYEFGYDETSNPGSAGFSLQFSATSEVPPPPPACVTTLSSDAAELDYRPAQGYPNNQDCSWYIDPGQGAQEISLSFDSIAVEEGWDFVTVRQCVQDAACREPARTPGTRRALLQTGSGAFTGSNPFPTGSGVPFPTGSSPGFSGGFGLSGGGFAGSCQHGYRCDVVLARLTGSQVPEPLVSTTGIMQVQFQSDISYSDEGFLARYETAREIYMPECTQVVATSNSAGYIDFLPPQPQPFYGNGQNCRWLIALPASTTKIAITFPTFETEACCDKVRLFQCAQSLDAASTTCQNPVELWNYGGAAPAPIEFSASRMLVTFASDGSGVGRGFRLEYDSVQQDSAGGANQGVFVVRFTLILSMTLSQLSAMQPSLQQVLATLASVSLSKVRLSTRDLAARRRLLASTEVSVEIEVADQQAALALASSLEAQITAMLASQGVSGVQFAEPPSAVVVNKCPSNEVLVDQLGTVDFWYPDSAYAPGSSCGQSPSRCCLGFACSVLARAVSV